MGDEVILLYRQAMHHSFLPKLPTVALITMAPLPVLLCPPSPPPLTPMPGRSHRSRVSLGSSVSFSHRLLRSCCNIYFAIIDSAIQSPCGSHFSLFAPLHIVRFTQLAFAQPGVVF